MSNFHKTVISLYSSTYFILQGTTFDKKYQDDGIYYSNWNQGGKHMKLF